MNKSIKFINNYLNDNDTVICACSGGPDSMVLINLLIDVRKEKNINIICAHANHSLRKESDEEYIFVNDFCKNNNITFEGTKFSNYNNENIESAARKKRYSFFDELAIKYNAKYLFTAHHGDDLVETILMKITRGSNIDSLIGFDFELKKDNYTILRPLVFYTKSEIIDYAKEKNIEFRVDQTNFDKKYTRNRYRMNILPLLKEEDKNIHLKYLKISNELKENNNFINNYVNKKYEEIVTNNMVNLELLLNEDDFIIKKIVYNYLKNIYKDNIFYIESKHINNILEIIKNNKVNSNIDLPNNITLIKKYDYLTLKDDTNNSDYKIELIDEVKVNDGVIKKVDETKLSNNYVCFLDSKRIKLPLYIRNKKDGDRITLLGLNKSKKIKDIFIDEKVDIEKRDKYPVLVDSEDNILWLPGLKKSNYDEIKTGKYDIILWYEKGEGENE